MPVLPHKPCWGRRADYCCNAEEFLYPWFQNSQTRKNVFVSCGNNIPSLNPAIRPRSTRVQVTDGHRKARQFSSGCRGALGHQPDAPRTLEGQESSHKGR